ncbi:DNRLRE domain-containing protein (plasmid) [Planococcus maritimus]|uniref:DNRLRE domain-containing protein n=1 Tax=Planococcus maritimus TaxID=192421 RepID=UPI00313A0ABB
MKSWAKLLVYLLSTLLIFTSVPWNLVTEAQGNTEYEERLGLNDPENEYTIPVEDPEAEIPSSLYTTSEAPAYPEEGEVVEERTAVSKVFSNGDGTFTEEIYPEPIHTEETPGEWKEISTTLIEDPKSESVSGEQTELQVDFPTEVEDTYVTIESEGQQLEYELVEAEGPGGKVAVSTPTVEYEENKIFHREIFPNVDLRSILFDTSLKEDIILTKAVDYDTFRFQIHTDLTGELTETGGIDWKKGKDIIFQTPAPVMMDANIDEKSGESAQSLDLDFTLEENETGYLLTLKADAEWLNSPERIYPIYLDPTTSLPTAADTFVSSAWPSANYDAYFDSNVGYYSLRAGAYDASTGTQYSYLKQNIDHLKDATIESATFSIYTAHSYYETTPTGLWIDAVSTNWSPSTITWNNKPSSTPITSTEVYKGQWANFDVTSTVKQWVDGTKPNYGFKLHTNGNGKTHWKRFYASENNTNKPYLSVTYSYPTMEAPTVTTTNNNNKTDTGALNVTWPSVPGAKEYIVYLYNGVSYQGIPVGNATSWSTKDKGIWPTDEQLYNGIYRLSTTGKGQDLPVDPSETYTVSGGKYATEFDDKGKIIAKTTKYWVRVAAVYDGGTSSMSPANTPYMTLSKPEGVKGAASINLDNTTGYISASWEPVQLATGYQVLLYNGKSYEQVADIKVDPTKPDQALQWSSQNQKIWPTAAEAASGRFTLHTDGGGMELPKDPTPVYQAAGGSFGSNPNYHVRIKAYDTNHPLSSQSNWFKSPLPDKQELIGEEAYWPTVTTPAGTVNAINGNLTFDETDASFTGRGPSIDISRTYNSLSDQVGSFGKGWLFSYDIKVEELANKDVQLTEEDGTIHVFKYVTTGVYSPPHGLYLDIKKDATHFILTTKNQDKLYFNHSTTDSSVKNRLEKIEDGEKKENQVTLTWTPTLLTITDASGRSILVTFSSNRITQVKDYGGRTWSYQYTSGLLTGYTDSTGAAYSYVYGNGKITTIVDAIGKSMVLGYDASNRLTSVKDAVGKTTTVSYAASKASIVYPAAQTYNGEATSNPEGGAAVTSTDTISYDTAGNPTSLITDVGTGRLNLKTSYTYALHELVKTVDPQMGTETAVYDSEGNELEVVGANNETITASYNENNDVVATTDAKNNTYTAAYDGTLEVSTNDPSKTSAVTEYDAFGNVTKSSKEMSVGFNHLTNSGFEKSSSTPENWDLKNLKNTGTVSLTSTGAKQNRALMVTSKPNADVTSGTLSYTAATQQVPVKKNTLYTLSGLIKTSNLQGRAFFNVQFLKETKDENGNIVTASLGYADNRYHYLSGTNSEWTERQLSFVTPEGATHVLVYLQVDNYKAGLSGGTAIFDNVQLEYGEVSSSYNPVVNSGFEEASDTIPTAFTGWTSGDLGAFDEEEVFDGDLSAQVLRKNPNDPLFSLRQTIQLNQQKAAPISVSALSKALEVVGNPTTQANDGYNLYLRAYNKAGTQIDYSHSKFAMGTHDWQKVVTSVQPSEPIYSVNIYLSFNGKMTGTAWFDSVRLQEGLMTSESRYDEKGNQLEGTTDELGNQTSYSYDQVGNQTSVTDAKGQVTSHTYNKANQLETTSLPGSDAQIHYSYDKNGSNTEKIVRSKANNSVLFSRTNYVYDDAGQLLSQSYHTPEKEYRTSFAYNARGAVQSTTYPTGSNVSVLYDSADRSTGLIHTLPGQAPEQITSYKLDGNGNQKEIHNLLTNSVQYQEFDKGNRVIQQSNGTATSKGNTIDWTFDANDNVTTEKITNGSTVYSHDLKYNATNLNTELEGPTSGKYRFQYDETGNVKAYSGPNATFALFKYDERSLVNSIDIGHNEIGELVKFGYEYDATSNRTKQSVMQQFATRATLTGTVEYQYDGMSQLKRETIPLTGEQVDYEYDVLGNRTQMKVTKNGAVTKTVAHTFNARNQLVRVKEGTASVDWTYDDNGNLLDDGKYTYTWDADNRLRKVHAKVGGTQIAEYWYDDADRRIRKNVGGTITNYVYDGDGLNVLYETNASHTITAYHSYNANGQLMTRTEVSGSTQTPYYYHYNAHGDVVMVTKAGGTSKADLIVASYVYDAWGNIVYQEGSYATKNPYRYAGYQFDTETNQYYLMARYYNPKAGVFTSMDPDPGDDDDILTQNGYTYANNNPVMLVDPDGHYVWLAINAGFAAYDGYKAYKAGKKAGKSGWKLAGSVAWASGSSFVKVGHLKKASKAVGIYNSKRAAKRAAFRDAGIGKHGSFKRKNITLNKGSRHPHGPSSQVRKQWVSSKGHVVAHDRYGHLKGEGGKTVGPHFNVYFKDGRNKHYYYKSKHDPRTNK